MTGGSDVAAGLVPGARRLADLAAAGTSMAEVAVPEARTRLAALVAAFGTGDEVGGTEDIEVPGAEHALRARVYRPVHDAGLPPLLYLHGGGWCVGDVDTTDSLCRKLCRRSGMLVVSLDYRLAPEHPFPAAFDDVVAALRWLDREGRTLGAVGVAVGGDSAGGNLAAAAALALRGDPRARVQGQLLICPPAHLDPDQPSFTDFAEGYFATAAELRHWVRLYAAGAALDDPRLSPGRASDLAGSPPALVVTAECDPLRDSGEEYAGALRAAGTDARTLRRPGQIHDFPIFGDLLPEADDAVTDRRDLARTAHDREDHRMTTPTLRVPPAPSFASVADERRHRKQQLAGALRIFGRLGYDEGVAGHITVRDPGDPETFWVNPFGVSFGRISVRDLVLVDPTGEVIEGTRAVNQGAFVIHSAIHDLRPDVAAAAHAHSIHGRALAALGVPLRPVVQEACAFFEDQAVYRDYNGLALEEAEGRRMAAALGRSRAVVLKNHGVITVGGSVEEAAYWFVSFDRAAQVQLLAEAAGPPSYLDDEAARLAHTQFGSPQLARFSFQILWDDIVHAQPDLLDE